jgi:hypothetical protein
MEQGERQFDNAAKLGFERYKSRYSKMVPCKQRSLGGRLRGRLLICSMQSSGGQQAAVAQGSASGLGAAVAGACPARDARRDKKGGGLKHSIGTQQGPLAK